MSREVGMILDDSGHPIATVIGDHSHVDFPFEMAWDYFRSNKGNLRLVHSHPRGFNMISEEDRTTLKAWAYTFYPYRVWFTIVTPMGREGVEDLFIHDWWYELFKDDDKKPIMFMESLKDHKLSLTSIPKWLDKLVDLSNY